MGHRPLVVACALLAGCKFAATFDCAIDEQCGAGGVCQPTGYCSFADATCPSGQRYDDHAGGGLAGACLDPFAPDAPAPDAAPDAAFDAPPVIDATPPIDAFPPLTIRINVGGGAHTGVDYPGTWAADPSAATCPGSTQYKITNEILGTVDDALFQTIPYSLDPLTCRVPSLPAGAYQVQLLFAEVFYDCPGDPSGPHVLDVSAEGMAQDTLDSQVDGGGCAFTTGHPFSTTFVVPVIDGQLDVTIEGLNTVSGIIAAIEVIRVQ